METQRTKLVVVNEHTLGYITPEQPKTLCILHASVLRGAVGTTISGPKMINPNDTVRLASEKDFEDYRVHFGSFNNSELYIFVGSFL